MLINSLQCLPIPYPVYARHSYGTPYLYRSQMWARFSFFTV